MWHEVYVQQEFDKVCSLQHAHITNVVGSQTWRHRPNHVAVVGKRHRNGHGLELPSTNVVQCDVDRSRRDWE